MARDRTQTEAWQAEKDLLADGRELLERLSDTTRYRHLYPEGPNVALLLEAYQDLARRRLVQRESRTGRPGERRRDRRRLRRLLKRKVRRDALARDRRLHFRYPAARNRRLRTGLPPVVRRALEHVDYDVRDDIARVLRGEERASFSADRSISSQSRIEASLDRGLAQFRDALINGALADPSSILSLNLQHIAYTSSGPPTKARHPIATLVLVKMPLQLMMLIWILFSSAYIGAYAFFNDEVLGRFLTNTLSPILDGELAFESIHWEPTLIVDLITGNPHGLRVQGVRVYEPYKSLGQEKDQLAAYAEDLELSLTLHEIIPWNRLGVPPVLEIPWVLHFSDVHNHGELWVRVREYEPAGTDRRLIGLIDAFAEPVETPSKAGYRKLSVRLDDADLPGARVILDFREFGSWGTDLAFDELQGDLDFYGWVPEEARPDPLPLRWGVRGKHADGVIWMLGKELAANDLSLDDVGSGMHFTPLGDMRLRGEGTVAGSPAKFDGFLRGIYADEKSVSYVVSSTDAHEIVQVFTAGEGDERPMIAAQGRPARLNIEGPLEDPSLRMVAQGITVDLFPDPGWALDDVDASLVMTRDPVPEMWANDRPADAGGDDERWILYLETLRGAALDGSVRLHGKGQLDHVVLADDESDPLLASIHLDLDGINPGQLAPEDPELQEFLRGAADGGAELDKLVLAKGGSGGLERLHFFLHRAHLARDHGPHDDGLPRHLWADGDVLYDRAGGLDLRGLKLSTEGGYVAGSGGLDAEWKHLEPTSLAVRIDDGASFSRAFAIDQYFERLSAEMALSGPLFAPIGRNGSLSISGVGSGDLSLTGVTNAKLWMDAGVLHLRSPNAGLLGGHGPLELDVVLFERGKLLSDPRVRLFVDLEGVDQRNIGGGPIDAEGASLRLYVDDGNGGPVRLSELQARGAAYADSLKLGGERYRNANASFAVTRDGIRIDQLTVSYHRPVSPRLAPAVTVEVGTLQAKGSIGFEDDPQLDLDLRASGLPLAALTGFIGEALPLRGQLAQGSRIALRGTVSRPEVDGHVELDSLSGFGVPLGRGRLDFETNDVPADAAPGQTPHRAVAIQGSFRDSRVSVDRGGLAWKVDATVAFGEARRRSKRPVEIDAGATFASLPVANLLAQPGQSQWQESVEGQLNDLQVRARYCPEGSSMLEACGDRDAETPETRVNIDLAHLWLRPRGEAQAKATVASGDPCLDPTTLCSDAPLHSVLEGDRVRLTEPWRLRTGGKDRAVLSVAGTFDLSEAPPTPATTTCRPGQPTSTPGGSGDAELEGEFDLAALAAVLRPYDIQPPSGRVTVALEVDGHAASPRVRGQVRLPPNRQALELEIGEQSDRRERRKPTSIPVALSDLDLDLQEDTVYVAGAAKIFDETIRFGTTGGPRSSLAVSGPCRGRYELSANGTLDAALVGVLGGEVVESSSGSADLSRIYIAGDLQAYSEEAGLGSLIDSLSGEISFKRKAFRMRLPYEALTIVGGKLQFRRCSAQQPCQGMPEGAYALFVGGEQGAGAGSRPRDALSMSIGDRGHADAWGQVYLDEGLDDVRSATLRASVRQLPYAQSDNAGAPELTASLSSRDLVFERDDLGDMVVHGKVLVEKGRWLRDAQQGVAILSFADPVPAPPDELPEAIRDLRLDLQLQTTAPFRVDNNVLKKFEAEGELSVAGTLEHPEVTGTVTVDRGELDLDILGEAYEVAEGKVRLDRVISSSFVDIVAIGKQPKKIDEQLHYITLRLRGPLDEISWECSALGDTSNELGSTRRCVDYLIFDAGNVDVAEQDVRRVGGTGLLYAGRPLTLVGKLTQLELNDYLEERIPRVERYLPYAKVRLGQLGIETEIETRPEWLNWGWGDLGFGFNYMRGYPGGLVRDTRAFTGRLEILDHSAFEFTQGTRNYTNRVLILDPPSYSRLEFLQNWQIPSAR